MKILAIDTSCDETAAAVTEDKRILSNIIWSQASLHEEFGGVMPSLAERMHNERIDFVVNKALKSSGVKIESIDCIAVTIGPGLSIALGVGISKAKALAIKYNKPLIPINHTEAHLLSCLAKPNTEKSKSQNTNSKFPAYGICVSGGNTVFVLIEKIGKYKILAETQDDALGEALDKAARMLGLGYPGGAILEKMAKKGDHKKFELPIPLHGQESRMIFSYSGLKTAFYRLIESGKKKSSSFPTARDIYNLAATFQDRAFKHIERVLSYHFSANHQSPVTNHLLLGGGVAANVELRKRLRSLGRKLNFKLHAPYSKKLFCDNAAMIGVAAYLKITKQKIDLKEYYDYSKIDRKPRFSI